MKLVLLIVSVVSVLAGYFAFGREYAVAYFSRSPDFRIFESLASQSEVIRLPFSSRGMREVFEVCGNVQQGIIYELQPENVRQVIDGKCLDLAQAALADNPTYGAAYTIKMVSSTQPQDIRAATVLSQRTSAYESWGAKLRLAKSIGLVGTGDADFEMALRDDIVFLAQTNGGRAWLADLYGRVPKAQSLLTQTLETRPVAEKSDFLQKVRAGG